MTLRHGRSLRAINRTPTIASQSSRSSLVAPTSKTRAPDVPNSFPIRLKRLPALLVLRIIEFTRTIRDALPEFAPEIGIDLLRTKFGEIFAELISEDVIRKGSPSDPDDAENVLVGDGTIQGYRAKG